MTNITLLAEVKSVKGTGASRRLRIAGKMPAIIYGNGGEVIAITLEHNKVLQATDKKAFYENNIIIELDGKTETVKVKALQRHPYKPKILHADFVRV